MKKRSILMLAVMMISLNTLGSAVWAAENEVSCEAPSDAKAKDLSETKEGSKDTKASTASGLEEQKK
ncbi:MAG: hypothetical protein H7222_06450 [Methylotenera sp.]|nr:hypothetical protein [Oligoflexia bacterium]